MGFPSGSAGEESACSAGDLGSISGKIPWRRTWLPTPVFLPGEFHRQRSLAGYNPWSQRVGPNWATNKDNSQLSRDNHEDISPLRILRDLEQ